MNKKRFIEEFFEDNYMTKGRKPGKAIASPPESASQLSFRRYLL